MCKNVIVFFGGASSENEISVITGTLAVNVLKRGGHVVMPVFITQRGDYLCGEALADIANFRGGPPAAPSPVFCRGGLYVPSKRGRLKSFFRADCAVNCCHGGWGEGGGISGLCAALSVPLASAGIFESAAFLDKYLTKIVLKGLGVPVVQFRYLRSADEGDGIDCFPVVVKPARLGSSIGVAVARNREELAVSLAAAFELDTAVLVERYVWPRREINCAACMCREGLRISPCEEVFGGDLLSYDDKYSGSGKRVCPADLSPALAEGMRDIVRTVYLSLNMKGIVRFDFILEGDDIYVGEINTVPGSLSHYLLAHGYNDFGLLLGELMKAAVAEAEREGSKLLVNTGIVNNFASNACKIK